MVFWPMKRLSPTNNQVFAPCTQLSLLDRLLEATDSWAFNKDRGNVNAFIFLDWTCKKHLIPLITMFF